MGGDQRFQYGGRYRPAAGYPASPFAQAMGLILWFDGQTSLAMWCLPCIAAILPLLLCLHRYFWGGVTKSLWAMPVVTLIGFYRHSLYWKRRRKNSLYQPGDRAMDYRYSIDDGGDYIAVCVKG